MTIAAVYSLYLHGELYTNTGRKGKPISSNAAVGGPLLLPRAVQFQLFGLRARSRSRGNAATDMSFDCLNRGAGRPSSSVTYNGNTVTSRNI